MCIVKPDGPPQLCKTDEIGEIIVNSRAGGNMYYGLPGVTKNTFEVRDEAYAWKCCHVSFTLASLRSGDPGQRQRSSHRRDPLCALGTPGVCRPGE